jgi:hypothetical protein
VKTHVRFAPHGLVSLHGSPATGKYTTQIPPEQACPAAQSNSEPQGVPTAGLAAHTPQKLPRLMSQYPVWHSPPVQQLASIPSDPVSGAHPSARSPFRYAAHDCFEVALAQLAMCAAVTTVEGAVAFASHSFAIPSRHPARVPYSPRSKGRLH